ncbi:MAG: hypothetical protein ACJ77E_06790 [Gaiellaceae bacterium]
MPRRKLRSQGDVVARTRELDDELRAALAQTADETDPGIVDAVWRGEGLGVLLWALQLAELPAYDEPFDAARIAGAALGDARLRDEEEIELERESARLWHWRARATELQAAGAVELPGQYSTFDQLIAATAMRGFEQGVLPAPVRGDFRAYGRAYRQLTPEERAEAHSIAVERHHALNWLCGEGPTWEDVPLDT